MPPPNKKLIACILIITLSLLIYLQADWLLQKTIKIYLAHASSIEAVDYNNFTTIHSTLEAGGMGLGIRRGEKIEFYDTLEFRASIILNNEVINESLTRILSTSPQEELTVKAQTKMNPDVINVKLALLISSRPTVKLNFDQISFHAHIHWTISIEKNHESIPISNGYGIVWEASDKEISRAETMHQEENSLTHIINNAYENPIIQLRIKEITEKLNIKPPFKIKFNSTIYYQYYVPKIGFKIKDETEAEIGEIVIQKISEATTINLTFKTPIIEKEVKIIDPNTEIIRQITLITTAIAIGILIATIPSKQQNL
ncbi:MAG: hypothetical protein NDF54_01485 [archaeon GB-1867-035]|nr:hypothetical protein [Candidatus Culexmicrobium profundum]